MSSRRVVLVTLAFSLGLALAGHIPPAHAQEWLPNGGFESPPTGWVHSRGTPVDCQPFEGGGAIGIAASAFDFPSRALTLNGQYPAATYTFAGWVRVPTGSAEIALNLTFDQEVDTLVLPAQSQYAAFSHTVSTAATASRIYIDFAIETEGVAEVCFDSLSLTTPEVVPTPTATATATQPVPTQTPPPTATTPSGQPTATSTLPPSVTPTSTPVATATAVPSATTIPGPTFVFTNGGFEQGLLGWQHYGGDLQTTSTVLSGASAGLLVSTTDSTKWAYQSVAVSPATHYELSAYVMPAENAIEAKLRISWYASNDATGAAIATSDSLSAAVAGNGYVLLTTGPVMSPPGAFSARVRILLVPGGAAYSTLAVDDAWFGSVAAPAATPTTTPDPSATPAPSTQPTLISEATLPPIPTVAGAASPASPATATQAAVSSGAAAAAAATSSSSSTASPSAPASAVAGASPVAEVAFQRSAAPSPTAFADTFASNRDENPESSRQLPWPWLLGGGLVALGVGGAFLQKRRAT